METLMNTAKAASLALAGPILAAALASAALAQAPARPPQPPAPPAVPEALALEAAQSAIAACQANGYKVAAAVVDSAGGTHLLVGAEGIRQGALDSSIKKAFTALTMKVPSAAIEAQAKTDTALQAKIAADPRLFARAGGLPITVKGEIVGAIGVGGAPGGDKDEACATAALAKIKDRLG
jgi:uncharacterized protein GlcG (DUF336 family)